ncbi:hypothetical protein Ac2012v2_006418 [Leucoagaricus gongylophorus]
MWHLPTFCWTTVHIRLVLATFRLDASISAATLLFQILKTLEDRLWVVNNSEYSCHFATIEIHMNTYHLISHSSGYPMAAPRYARYRSPHHLLFLIDQFDVTTVHVYSTYFTILFL